VKRRSKQGDHDDSAQLDAFERAMAEADVVRLPPDHRERVRPASQAGVRHTPPPPASSAPDRDAAEGLEAAFVASGVDRRELRKLKRGEYPVRARLDLHGMTATEAVASVKRFIENSRHARHRCVTIVHGRGLHSEGNVAILKTRARECLRQHRAVLAYADAPRDDGGTGAVYVLLRR